MAAPKGNQFWKLRSKHGRDKLFTTPVLLWKAACEYFEWCEKHPLKEQKVFNNKGEIVKTEVNLMRAFTLRGLCFYLNCNDEYFRIFKKQTIDEDFNRVIRDIENIIYTQKFEGAAAGLLNANIIARDLGLADKKEVEANVKHDLSKMTNEEIEKEINRLDNI